MTQSAENDAPESPFGPLDENGHDGHARRLNGMLADCPGCVTPPAECGDYPAPCNHDPAHEKRDLPPGNGDNE